MTFADKRGKPVLLAMVQAVKDNKDYLSEVDGKIGDGDHGMNMNKGFSLFGERIASRDEVSLARGLGELGSLLLTQIGGSMGPIYGTLFMEMADAGEEEIDAGVFLAMLEAGYDALCDVVEAREGDKTLMDALTPALRAAREAAGRGEGLEAMLPAVKKAAQAGCEATVNMVAKFGRSSRLGERSRGVPDAGATSCALLLGAMADAMLGEGE